jgi:tetratricopeptide (TPR) repeat protein
MRVLLLLALLLCGGVRLFALEWERGWSSAQVAPLTSTSAPSAPSSSDTARGYEEARRLTDAVDSAESARLAVEAWQRVAQAAPEDPQPWTELASLHLLEGAAFRSKRSDKLQAYKAALTASERAMATHPEFRRRVLAGEDPWRAAEVLGAEEVGAMHFWVTGVFYIFKDCLGTFGRVRHVRWMKGARQMIDRMDAVDASWGGHVSEFSRGIFYLAMPRFQGGDREKARQSFDRSVDAAPDRTVARWGRAKYFHPEVGDAAAALADLRVVAAQPLDSLQGSRSWNRFIQRDAQELLHMYQPGR